MRGDRPAPPTMADWRARAGDLRLKQFGQALVGPCPACGGRDRFSVKKGRDGRPLVYCRHCDPGQRNPSAFRAIMEAAGFGLDRSAPRPKPKPRRPVRRIIPWLDEPGWYAAQREALRLNLRDGTARKVEGKDTRLMFRHRAIRGAGDG